MRERERERECAYLSACNFVWMYTLCLHLWVYMYTVCCHQKSLAFSFQIFQIMESPILFMLNPVARNTDVCIDFISSDCCLYFMCVTVSRCW